MPRPINEWVAEFCMMFGPEQITRVGLLEGEAEFYMRMAKDTKSNVNDVIRFIHTVVRTHGNAGGLAPLMLEKRDTSAAMTAQQIPTDMKLRWLGLSAAQGEMVDAKVFLAVVDDVNGVNLPNSRYPGKESE